MIYAARHAGTEMRDEDGDHRRSIRVYKQTTYTPNHDRRQTGGDRGAGRMLHRVGECGTDRRGGARHEVGHRYTADRVPQTVTDLGEVSNP